MALKKFIFVRIIVFFGFFLAVAVSLHAQVIVEDTVSITARVAPENTIIFTGDACPSCQVFLLLSGSIEDSSTSLGNGSFQLSIEDIPAGTYQFGVYAVDLNSVQSGTSSFSVTISQGVIVFVSDILVSPTLQSDYSNVVRGETITLSGYTVPNGDVTIDVDSGDLVIQMSAALDGEFYYQLDTSNLQIGTHSAEAFVKTATDTSGNSRLVEFEVTEESTDEEDEDEDEEEDEEDTCDKADYDDNNKVNIVDFSILIHWYEKSKVPGDIDLNDDDDVDMTDFSILIYCWTG
ncbi:MAG: hypothetical protein U9M90_00660 [Patescibacteria group bacterium]|nr:hypothetical protein [Patescibacteria group bacterium]